MNIVFAEPGSEDHEKLAERYHLFKTDSVQLNDRTFVAYVVLSADDVPLEEISKLSETVNLHEKLMENYEKGNIPFVEQAIEYLRGRNNNLMDGYYDAILDRINKEPV